jgi:hypothetical protein
MEETRIVRTVPLATDIETAVAWCRSADSRRCWPGAQETWWADNGLFYHVTMKLPGAEQAEMLVEEHLREVTRIAHDEIVFESQCEWRWPAGDVGTVSTSYRFTADPNTLEFVMCYRPPGTAVGARINRHRFDPAMGKVVVRYTSCLAAPTSVPALAQPGHAPTWK